MIRANRLLVLTIVVLLALGMLLPACGETATATPTKAAVGSATSVATPSKPVATPTPPIKIGGAFTIIHSVESVKGQLDPHYGGISGFMTSLDNIYESLLGHDLITFDTVPKLAEKWELAPDATSVTLFIRKGVKWHNVPPVNGREFTAADVKWNIDRIVNAKPAMDLTTILSTVSKVEVVDTYTVKISMSKPFASIMWWLADSNFPMYPRELQEAYGDKQAKTAIGTGPFMFKSYEPTVSLEMKKNPDYWQKDLPRVDTLKFLYIADPAARLAALRAGQADSQFSGFSTADKESLQKSNPDFQVFETVGVPYGIRLNASRKPFDDIRVRQAVNLALDRQALVQLALGGGGAIQGHYGPALGPFERPMADLLKLPGYRQPKDQDLAEAKRLLAAAGYPNGLTVEALTVSSPASFITANEVIKDQLAKVGITWSIKVEDFAKLSQRTLTAKPADYEACVMSMSARGDPDVSTYYLTSSPANTAGWGSPEIDALLSKGQAEGDITKRVAVYRQLEDKLFEIANNLPIYTVNGYVGVAGPIRDYRSSSRISQAFLGENYKYVWRSDLK